MNREQEQIIDTALRNQEKARRIIRDSKVVEIWEAMGMEVNMVGSMRTGLFMKHRDIDFHIYSDAPAPALGLEAMAKLAENKAVKRIEYINGMDTEEKCIEYHAWYQDEDGDLWQFDMIHIQKGSKYDGFFERFADRLKSILTPETKIAILSLKNSTPDIEKIPGIEYYVAVIRDGVRTYDEFTDWRRKNPATGVIEWMP